MEILNSRAALLSNYEVYNLLRELESDHLARSKTALRIKKEEEAAGNSAIKSQLLSEDVCENLRTIEVEAIQYLSADYQPTALQSEAGITQLTHSLAAYELTKAEKLQIVNLAPTEPVELYVVVEELEDRFGEKMDEILNVVRSSLSEPASQRRNEVEGAAHEGTEAYNYTYTENEGVYAESWDYDANEQVFDDTGEGAGVEGDLDVDDD